jgi:DNA-directed RNA polymerase sigma subunit (sigma70/sigma32)
MRIYSYTEIGEELGLTCGAVRKIEQRALRKVRKALRRRGMTFEDLLPTETHHEPQDAPQWVTTE